MGALQSDRAPVVSEQEHSVEGASRASVRAVLPHRLPYRDGDPVPPGYRVESHLPVGLVVTGGLLLGGGYVLGAGMAANDTGGVGGGPWVPVVGPFIGMASIGFSCPPESKTLNGMVQEDSCPERLAEKGRAMALLLIDGLMQVSGAAMLGVGLLADNRELVRQTEPQAVLRPIWAPGHYGAALIGRF